MRKKPVHPPRPNTKIQDTQDLTSFQTPVEEAAMTALANAPGKNRWRKFKQLTIPDSIENSPVERVKQTDPRQKPKIHVRTNEDGEVDFYSEFTGRKMPVMDMPELGGDLPMRGEESTEHTTRKNVVMVKNKRRIDAVVLQDTLQRKVGMKAVNRLSKLIDSSDEFVAVKAVDIAFKYSGIASVKHVNVEVKHSFSDFLRDASAKLKQKSIEIDAEVKNTVKHQHALDKKRINEAEEYYNSAMEADYKEEEGE